MNVQHFILTKDHSIRAAVKKELENECVQHRDTKIIEELGIIHGTARIDIAVVNGSIHGYELKSDKDTLKRLPGQVEVYNSVLDKVTLVVGKSHLYEALEIVPEWWGITIAKAIDSDERVSLYKIREAERNPCEERSVAMAALLWREEALAILEKIGHADGVRSKSRAEVYLRLAQVLKSDVLAANVREYLRSRINWRSGKQYIPSGG